jgi:hypothetical protein
LFLNLYFYTFPFLVEYFIKFLSHSLSLILMSVPVFLSVSLFLALALSFSVSFSHPYVVCTSLFLSHSFSFLLSLSLSLSLFFISTRFDKFSWVCEYDANNLLYRTYDGIVTKLNVTKLSVLLPSCSYLSVCLFLFNSCIFRSLSLFFIFWWTEFWLSSNLGF